MQATKCGLVRRLRTLKTFVNVVFIMSTELQLSTLIALLIHICETNVTVTENINKCFNLIF